MTHAEYRPSEQPERQTPWRLIIFGILLAVTVIFILQNRERTTVDFLVLEVRARTWTSLLVAVGLGVLLDRLFTGWWRRRRANRDD